MIRLAQIEELEDRINDNLAVILVASHNCTIAVKQQIRCNEEAKVLEYLQMIDLKCKELAKLTAIAIGKLRAYDNVLGGD